MVKEAENDLSMKQWIERETLSDSVSLMASKLKIPKHSLMHPVQYESSSVTYCTKITKYYSLL